MIKAKIHVARKFTEVGQSLDHLIMKLIMREVHVELTSRWSETRQCKQASCTCHVKLINPKVTGILTDILASSYMRSVVETVKVLSVSTLVKKISSVKDANYSRHSHHNKVCKR